MAIHQTTRQQVTVYLVLVVALLAAFYVSSTHLTREDLWDDEGFTMWFVRDSNRPPESFGESIQFVRASLGSMLARVRADVHPPLYFFILDLWTLLAGSSIYVVRLLSALFALLSLAATYAVGKQLFKDYWLALLAMIILATGSFFVYYAREARMYALLLALTPLSVWAYVSWARKPSARRSVIYGVLMTLLVYTHYLGALVILSQGIHSLIFRGGASRGRSGSLVRSLWPYALAFILFAPWLPPLLTQWRLSGGPGAVPIPTNWTTLAALFLILTNGHWALYIAPFVFGSSFLRLRQHTYTLVLLMLWLLLLPVILLVINAWLRPIFQIRYTTPVLPAFALLVAYGFRYMDFPFLRAFPSYAILRTAAVLLFIGLIYAQLVAYSQLWPAKPRWEQAVQQMTAERQPLETAITSIPPRSPSAYYERLYPIRQGISLDLSWRWQEPDAIDNYVERMRTIPSVWIVMPSHYASTWDAVRALLQDRGVGYRDSVMDMVFYRFDFNSDPGLQFRFGNVLALTSGINHQLYAITGEPFCFDLSFSTLQAVDDTYTLELALTQGYDTWRALQSLALDTYESGDNIVLTPCINVPEDAPAGPYHLRVRVRHHGTLLPLVENERLYWGEELITALVSVE